MEAVHQSAADERIDALRHPRIPRGARNRHQRQHLPQPHRRRRRRTEGDRRDESVIGNNKYAPVSEHRFHTKLYEITGNKIITEFQDIIYPVLDFVKEKYRDFLEPIEKELERAGALVTHRDLLKYIENRDLKGYKKAIEEHFRLYSIYLERHKKIAPEIMRPEGRSRDVFQSHAMPSPPSPPATPQLLPFVIGPRAAPR